MTFQVSDRRVGYVYGTKVKTLHLNYMPFICKMMQASISNDSVSECDWVTGLRITDVVTRKHMK